MNLKITHSEREQVLRSVGDQPNGVIGAHVEIDHQAGTAELVIRVWGSVDPDSLPTGVSVSESNASPDDTQSRAGSERLDWDEALAAVADGRTAGFLLGLATRAATPAIEYLLSIPWYDAARSLLDQLEDLVTTMDGRFSG
jgi:hypothetical protein